MTDIIVNLKATNFVQFETNLKIVFFLLIVSRKQNKKYCSITSQSKQSKHRYNKLLLNNWQTRGVIKMVRNFKQFRVLDFKKRDQTFHSDDLRPGLTKEIELELGFNLPERLSRIIKHCQIYINTNLSFHFLFALQWSSY